MVIRWLSGGWQNRTFDNKVSLLADRRHVALELAISVFENAGFACSARSDMWFQE
jgi:hypothetical protein